MGPSWAVLGTSWAILGGSCHVLGAPWSFPRPSGTAPGPQDPSEAPRLPPGPLPQDPPGDRPPGPGPGVAFCVEHRHAQLDNVLWHCLGMAAVDMCIYRGTDLQTKVRAPSPAPDVISCCAVICTCDKVGTPGTYICRIRGRSRARASRAGYAYRPPSHSSPPSPSRSG